MARRKPTVVDQVMATPPVIPGPGMVKPARPGLAPVPQPVVTPPPIPPPVLPPGPMPVGAPTPPPGPNRVEAHTFSESRPPSASRPQPLPAGEAVGRGGEGGGGPIPEVIPGPDLPPGMSPGNPTDPTKYFPGDTPPANPPDPTHPNGEWAEVDITNKTTGVTTRNWFWKAGQFGVNPPSSVSNIPPSTPPVVGAPVGGTGGTETTQTPVGRDPLSRFMDANPRPDPIRDPQGFIQWTQNLNTAMQAVPEWQRQQAAIPPVQPSTTPAQDIVNDPANQPPAGTVQPIENPDTAGQIPVTGLEPAAGTDPVSAFTTANPDPSQYTAADGATGVAAWRRDLSVAQKQRDAAAVTGDTGTAEVTPPPPLTTPADQAQQSSVIDDFISHFMQNKGDISPEEEATIRRQMGEAKNQFISSMSAKGMGLSSAEAIGEAQRGFATEAAVGQAKQHARDVGIEQSLKAAQLGVEKLRDDQGNSVNTYLANLKAQIDTGTLTLEGKKVDLARDEVTGKLKLSQEQLNETTREFNHQYNLNLTSEQFNEFLQTGRLNLDALTQDQRNALETRTEADRVMLTMRDQDIQQMLGIGKQTLENWLAGQNVDLAQGRLAFDKWAAYEGFKLDQQQVNAAWQAMSNLSDAERSKAIGQLFGTIIRFGAG